MLAGGETEEAEDTEDTEGTEDAEDTEADTVARGAAAATALDDSEGGVTADLPALAAGGALASTKGGGDHGADIGTGEETDAALGVGRAGPSAGTSGGGGRGWPDSLEADGAAPSAAKTREAISMRVESPTWRVLSPIRAQRVVEAIIARRRRAE